MIDKRDCVIWIGSKNEAGYGTIVIRGKQVRAHRFIYENVKGPVPKHLVIDHLCMNRACININHLEPVTIQENFRRAEEIYALLEKCGKGHPFTQENSVINGNKTICRKCAVVRMRKWRENHPEKVAQANSNRWITMSEEQKIAQKKRQKVYRDRRPKKIRIFKTHCIHGHSLADAFIKKNKTNSRDCRECSRIRAEKYRHANHQRHPFKT